MTCMYQLSAVYCFEEHLINMMVSFLFSHTNVKNSFSINNHILLAFITDLYYILKTGMSSYTAVYDNGLSHFLAFDRSNHIWSVKISYTLSMVKLLGFLKKPMSGQFSILIMSIPHALSSP